ncbi:MAG: TonB-dependent receptor [Gemmatimonadota bacterium]
MSLFSWSHASLRPGPDRRRSAVPFALLVFATALIGTVPAPLAGQEGATVAGRAVSAVDGSAIGLATVVVERTSSGDTLSGAIAGQDGRFVLRGLTPERYTVHVSFPGFFPESVPLLVSALNLSYDLGDIRLTAVGSIDELRVTVEAVRTAGVETQVFRIGEAAAQTTGSLLDAMRNLPGVTVDQDGKVSLRGSDHVAILIDGKPSSLTGFGSQRGLDNVPAANIEAIEIINNPSARFDAAGMAGIINIIYRQEQQLGLSGDFGLSLGLGQFSKQRPDLPTELGSFSTNEKIIPSVSLAYNTDRVRAFGHGEVFRQHDLPNNEFTTRFYDDGRVIESQVPENRVQTHYIFNGGSDVQLDDVNMLTVSGIWDFESHTDRAQVPFILDSTGERLRYWFWREHESTGFVNVTANWKHQFATPGQELDVNLQYTRGWEDEEYFLNEDSPVRVGRDGTHLKAVENTVPLTLDFVRPLASGRVELGGKLQRRWLPITYTVDRGVQSVIYDGLGDHSDWEEDLYAAYLNLVRITDTYTLEGGLRLEQTSVEYRIPTENIYYPGSDAYDYLELFPNVKLTWAFSSSDRLIAAYNRRIDRPGEPELRIFPKYDDPELLKVGNPFLRPQLTNVYELGYGRSWTSGSWTTSLYRRDISDAFLRIFAIDDSNANYDIVNKIYENAGNSTQTGVEVIVQQEIAGPWLLSGSVNWFRNEVDALQTTLYFPTQRPFSLSASSLDTWDLTVNNRIRVPGDGEVQLSFIRYGRRNVPQGFERARSSVDVSGKWPLADQNAELIFTFSDIFNDFGIRREVEGEGFTALYENLMETQVATVGIRWRFG